MMNNSLKLQSQRGYINPNGEESSTNRFYSSMKNKVKQSTMLSLFAYNTLLKPQVDLNHSFIIKLIKSLNSNGSQKNLNKRESGEDLSKQHRNVHRSSRLSCTKGIVGPTWPTAVPQWVWPWVSPKSLAQEKSCSVYFECKILEFTKNPCCLIFFT